MFDVKFGEFGIEKPDGEIIKYAILGLANHAFFSGDTWYVRRSKSRWNDVDCRDYLEYYNDRDNDLDDADIELFQENIVAVTRSILYEK
jgi:hypothetical protein